ncbi:MAG: methylated-DNA--[protein]-cysteine S-methyltransferase, partial [Pseudomonadota bacterium]
LKAWTALQKIQFGQTCSYRAEAITIDAPTAFRAVAQANGANPIGILIPCHRVVAANGTLGGYNSGVWRKTWLLAHEASVLTKNYQVDDQ